jgi:hypothetical protein
MTDLDKLIAAVEAGMATGGDDALVVPLEMSQLIFSVTGDDDELWADFIDAHDGSLDAALRMHEALLPGWSFDIGHGAEEPFYANVYLGTKEHDAGGDDPARSWLLAILRAVRGEKE